MAGTVNPFETILGTLDKNVGVLESKSSSIKPSVDTFRSDALGFNPFDISSSEVVDTAMNAWTPDVIGAGVTDIEPINQFADDCLAEALAGIRRYLKDILGNIESGVDLIEDIPERFLMKLLQKIKSLVADISNVISACDIKIECITSKDEAGYYTGRVQEIQDRINVVIDDLYLADNGSFDIDKLTTGVDGDLTNNLKAFKDRSDELQSEVQDNITTTVNLPTTVNPSNRF